MAFMLDRVGNWLARYLSQTLKSGRHVATNRPEILAAALRKGDVLLVEGNTRFSVAIKYLTQSSWSHSSICIGDALGPPAPGQEARVLVDADIIEGVRAIPLSAFHDLHTRICRPVGLSAEKIDELIAYVISRIGQQYDLKNVIDLMRYLIPKPPIPVRWRRRMLALGSGDPTKAICSSMIAQAFQLVHYPILPELVLRRSVAPGAKENQEEMLNIRHHSLFAPRDFDVSPYFQIVKPTIEHGFDPHKIEAAWRAADPVDDAPN